MKQSTFQLLIGLIAGFAIGWFFFHNCNKPKPCPDVPVVTSKIDTNHVMAVDSSGWYKPQITVFNGGKIPSANTGFYKPQPAKKDSATFSGDFDFTRPSDYLDESDSDLQSQSTFNFYKDRVNTKYGFVTIEDTLRNNQISARRVSTDFDIPVVTTTNTITLREKRKARLFWDLTAIGDQDVNINAAGGGFMFQFKDTRALQMHYLYQFRKLYPGQSNHQFQLTLVTPFSKK